MPDAPVRASRESRLARTVLSRIEPGDRQLLQLLAPQLLVSLLAISVFALWFGLPARFVRLHLITVAALQVAFFLGWAALLQAGAGWTRPAFARSYASALFIKAVALNTVYLASIATQVSWGSNFSVANARFAMPHLRGFREAFGMWVYLLTGGLVLVGLLAYALAWHAAPRLVARLRTAFPNRVSRPFVFGIAGVVAALAVEWWACEWAPAQAVRADPLLSFYLNPSPVTPVVAGDLAARRSYPKVTAFRRCNVIVITIDSLRADHLGVCGYTRDTSPFLSELRRTGALQALSTSVSVANDSAGGIFAVLGSVYVESQRPSNFTLSEVLRGLGYHTYLIGAGDHTSFDNMKPLYGTSYQLFSDGLGRRSWSVNDDRGILETLAKIPPADDRPAFFFFHLMSAHYLGVHLPQYALWRDDARGPSDPTRRRPGPANRTDAAYDAGVRQADDVVRQIFELLRAKGYLHDYVGTVTGDHGEALGEHDHFGHIEQLFQEDIAVPILLLDSERQPPLSVRFGCQLDIVPTLAERLGLPAAASWQGVSLLRADEPRIVFLHSKGGRSWRGLVLHERDADYKYLFLKHGTDRGREMFFNLSADPAEAHDLITHAPTGLLTRARSAASGYFSIPLP